VLAAEQLAETVTILGKDGFIAPGGPMNQLGAACFGIWIIAQGIAASGRHSQSVADQRAELASAGSLRKAGQQRA
jgi:hypothetical protein